MLGGNNDACKGGRKGFTAEFHTAGVCEAISIDIPTSSLTRQETKVWARARSRTNIEEIKDNEEEAISRKRKKCVPMELMKGSCG